MADDDPNLERFNLERVLGPLALLRLRAECLLEGAEAGTIPVTADERVELERIASAPRDDDGEFLGGFDRYLEEPDDEAPQ